MVQEAGWAPGPVWTVAEDLAHTGIRCPDRRASSESLYRYKQISVKFYIEDFYDYVNCENPNLVKIGHFAW